MNKLNRPSSCDMSIIWHHRSDRVHFTDPNSVHDSVGEQNIEHVSSFITVISGVFDTVVRTLQSFVPSVLAARRKRRREWMKRVSAPHLFLATRLLHSAGEMCLHHHKQSWHPAEGTANRWNREQRRQQAAQEELSKALPRSQDFWHSWQPFQRGQW